jgi:hypothetical protein
MITKCWRYSILGNFPVSMPSKNILAFIGILLIDIFAGSGVNITVID